MGVSSNGLQLLPEKDDTWAAALFFLHRTGAGAVVFRNTRTGPLSLYLGWPLVPVCPFHVAYETAAPGPFKLAPLGQQSVGHSANAAFGVSPTPAPDM